MACNDEQVARTTSTAVQRAQVSRDGAHYAKFNELINEPVRKQTEVFMRAFCASLKDR